MSRRVIMVSHRLPMTLTVDSGEILTSPSTGGLATGLASLRGELESLWIGCPGSLDALPAEKVPAVTALLAADGAKPVYLTQEQITSYYEGYSNGVLWPAFHYLLDRVKLDAESDFASYREVNGLFADAVAAEHRDGDLVWIHDYQLMLLPALLRERIPRARIGFFLHVPFPAAEVIRMIPRRRELLEGLLGADLVGFHDFSYSRHFVSSATRVLELESDIERIEYRGRRVRVGAFPMGIDADKFARIAAEQPTQDESRAIRGADEGLQIILGVDRLDYTKGLLRRILAIDRMLEIDPSLRGRFRLLQVAVPSRTGMDAYAELRRQLEATIGRVNGRHATIGWSPVRYLFRTVAESSLVALYGAADVMAVTPLRDGMNLVAKEFAASRIDEDGVLVLSEFAGAASELGSALLVNPYDVDATATALRTALAMPLHERRRRMRALRERVFTHDVSRWARTFCERLAGIAALDQDIAPVVSVTPTALAAGIETSARCTLLLDYDGTLVPIAATPAEAVPDDALIDLLGALSRRPNLAVHVVSGRDRQDLDAWLGGLPLSLHAEHGLWFRAPGSPWEAKLEIRNDWKPRVRRILEDFATRVPGALVEEKTAGLAWHYRLADPEFGSLQASELALHLLQLLANSPLEIRRGHKIVEVRQQGVSKALVVEHLPPHGDAGLVVAIGDDATDEDLFAAVPDGAVSVRVGDGPSRAGRRLASVAEVRMFLEAVLTRTERGVDA